MLFQRSAGERALKRLKAAKALNSLDEFEGAFADYIGAERRAEMAEDGNPEVVNGVSELEKATETKADPPEPIPELFPRE
jgi:hypothetical protein